MCFVAKDSWLKGADRSALLFVVAFVAAGQLLLATSRKEPCDATANGYIIAQSNLTYADVSHSYADSIYHGVREILVGFLASTPYDYCLFRDSGSRADLADGTERVLLDLYCEVGRLATDVRLSVRLSVGDSSEEMLSFQTWVPFLQPNKALCEFASSFPSAFAGHVLHEFSYPLQPNRFHTGPQTGELYFGDSIPWGIADLENDLKLIGGVPLDVLQSVSNYRSLKTTREAVANTIIGLGALTYAGTGVAILALGGLKQTGGTVPNGVWIANVMGLVAMVFGPIGLSLPLPADLIPTLNDWCCTSGQE